MAVVAMWMCDRDQSMFNTKKEADAHDKMLELAEAFEHLINHYMPSSSEQERDAMSIALAKSKDKLIEACRGQTAKLESIYTESEASSDASNVHELEQSA